MPEMPALETERLLVRPFVMDDLQAVHRLLDIELGDPGTEIEESASLERRARWLQWTVLNYEQLAALNQPPYGDRAVALRSRGELIGVCGFVPCLNAFEQLPSWSAAGPPAGPGRYSPAFGLYYAISPAYRRRGYASEAAGALVDYAFRNLGLARVVATTEYDNAASIGVMRRLGMRVERNPLPDPPWLQVVGILKNGG